MQYGGAPKELENTNPTLFLFCLPFFYTLFPSCCEKRGKSFFAPFLWVFSLLFVWECFFDDLSKQLFWFLRTLVESNEDWKSYMCVSIYTRISDVMVKRTENNRNDEAYWNIFFKCRKFLSILKVIWIYKEGNHVDEKLKKVKDIFSLFSTILTFHIHMCIDSQLMNYSMGVNIPGHIYYLYRSSTSCFVKKSQKVSQTVFFFFFD